MQKAFRYEPDDNNESGKGELRGARMYDMFDTMMAQLASQLAIRALDRTMRGLQLFLPPRMAHKMSDKEERKFMSRHYNDYIDGHKLSQDAWEDMCSKLMRANGTYRFTSADAHECFGDILGKDGYWASRKLCCSHNLVKRFAFRYSDFCELR